MWAVRKASTLCPDLQQQSLGTAERMVSRKCQESASSLDSNDTGRSCLMQLFWNLESIWRCAASRGGLGDKSRLILVNSGSQCSGGYPCPALSPLARSCTHVPGAVGVWLVGCTGWTSRTLSSKCQGSVFWWLTVELWARRSQMLLLQPLLAEVAFRVFQSALKFFSIHSPLRLLGARYLRIVV